MTTPHPFDTAIALTAQGDHSFTGHTSMAYANMVGPFGGASAAVMLNAVLQHPQLLGAPVSLTVNFCAGMADGPFRVQAQPARTNRSTQHWTVSLCQTDAQGQEHTVLTATAVTAVRRSTYSVNDTPMPPMLSPTDVPLDARAPPLPWVARYEMRFSHGAMPQAWDGQSAGEGADKASLTRVWVRDVPQRSLDFCSLAAMSDSFFPRVFLRRATRVPIGTVSMTVYFHADAAMLAQVGTGYLLGQARGQVFFNGFFDQTAQMWSEAGSLLATTHQVVYYKE
jgi:acyl-CoA thioesterase